MSLTEHGKKRLADQETQASRDAFGFDGCEGVADAPLNGQHPDDPGPQPPPEGERPEHPAPVVDGAELLDELRDTFNKYVAFPDEHASIAVTLWTATTHALPAFECAPRLSITSPQKLRAGDDGPFLSGGYANDQGTGFGSSLNIFGNILPRVVSPNCPQGTAILGDFSKAALFVRSGMRIDLDTSGELFEKNQIRLRAEMAVGFGVLRPSAFTCVPLSGGC